MKNFEYCLPFLLAHEGGNDDDINDPGGRTSRGILQTEYDAYRKRHGKPRAAWEHSEVSETEYLRHQLGAHLSVPQDNRETRRKRAKRLKRQRRRKEGQQ